MDKFFDVFGSKTMELSDNFPKNNILTKDLMTKVLLKLLSRDFTFLTKKTEVYFSKSEQKGFMRSSRLLIVVRRTRNGRDTQDSMKTPKKFASLTPKYSTKFVGASLLRYCDKVAQQLLLMLISSRHQQRKH